MSANAPLSVLDLAPVVAGSSPREALANSTDLVGRVEAMGYTRYWVAEHHNMPGIASSSPAVLLAHLASHSERIRLGSGGVMLPNHAPLVVAEQFGMLEALHPGRIDLGIGRAPGTDPLTAAALRRGDPAKAAEAFPQEFRDLLDFFEGSHRQGIRAVPGQGYKPAIWMLGSSDFGAQVAALLGLPFSFAHHFAPAGTVLALELYRTAFRPSATMTEPYSMIGVAVICAETQERAEYIARPGDVSFVRFRQGRPARLPSPSEAADYEFTPVEQQLLKQRAPSMIVGDPPTVEARLVDLLERTGANELMVTTSTFDYADRVRSYELLAKVWGVSGAPGGG